MISRLDVLLRRAKDVFQTEGLAVLARWAVTRWLFEHADYYLYRNSVKDTSPTDFMPRIQDFTCKIVHTNDEADELATTIGSDFRQCFIDARERLDKGAIAFCIFVKSEIAHIGWVALSEEAKKAMHPIPQKVDFSANEAYVSGGVTIPEYRGKGLSGHNFAIRMQFLRQRGVTLIRGAVRVNNIAPQILALRHGAEMYARARYLRILWYKSWKEKPTTEALQAK